MAAPCARGETSSPCSWIAVAGGHVSAGLRSPSSSRRCGSRVRSRTRDLPSRVTSRAIWWGPAPLSCRPGFYFGYSLSLAPLFHLLLWIRRGRVFRRLGARALASLQVIVPDKRCPRPVRSAAREASPDGSPGRTTSSPGCPVELAWIESLFGAGLPCTSSWPAFRVFRPGRDWMVDRFRLRWSVPLIRSTPASGLDRRRFDWVPVPPSVRGAWARPAAAPFGPGPPRRSKICLSPLTQSQPNCAPPTSSLRCPCGREFFLPAADAGGKGIRSVPSAAAGGSGGLLPAAAGRHCLRWGSPGGAAGGHGGSAGRRRGAGQAEARPSPGGHMAAKTACLDHGQDSTCRLTLLPLTAG